MSACEWTTEKELLNAAICDIAQEVARLPVSAQHARPREDLEETRRWITEHRVARIVSLAPLEEIRRKSPRYAEAIEQQVLQPDILPIEDLGVPEDQGAFVAAARSVADDLENGKNVLVHCGAGIGRTGTFTCCVLLALGRTLSEAQKA